MFLQLPLRQPSSSDPQVFSQKIKVYSVLSPLFGDFLMVVLIPLLDILQEMAELEARREFVRQNVKRMFFFPYSIYLLVHFVVTFSTDNMILYTK